MADPQGQGPAASGHEHRRAPRVARTFVVKYGWKDGERIRWDVSQTKNLSASGLRFSGERPFAVGDVLEFEILLSTTVQPIRVTGRIVWAHPTKVLSMIEYGVEFVNVDPEATRRLAGGLEFFFRHGS